MTNYLRVDAAKRQLVMDRTFAKNMAIVGSPEYQQLQEARRDYPTYAVIQRKINKKANQEHYKGLTYDYMERYIRYHEGAETVESALAELEDKKFISECHSKCKRYPVVKEWFLEKYPEIKQFGMTKEEIADEEAKGTSAGEKIKIHTFPESSSEEIPA